MKIFSFLLLLPCLLETQISFLSSLPRAVNEPDTWRESHTKITCVLTTTICFYNLQSENSSVSGASHFHINTMSLKDMIWSTLQLQDRSQPIEE